MNDPISVIPQTGTGTGTTDEPERGDSLLLAVEQLTAAHDRHGAERSDPTSSQNSLGDDGENRDLNLPRA